MLCRSFCCLEYRFLPAVDMGTRTWLCLLLAALNVAQIEGEVEKQEYFADGGRLVLRPTVAASEPLVNIVWKHKTNLLVDWVKSANLLEFFSTFVNRTELDVDTGRLTIHKMTLADEGVYTLELNNKPHSESYKATMIAKLRQPVTVVIRTLTCSDTSESCAVTCKADTANAGPVSYSWRFGEGEWKSLPKDTTITKVDHVHARTISCQVTNPVSMEESKPEPNPLFKEHPVVPTAAWAVPLVVLPVAAGLAGLLAAWILKKGPFKSQGANITASPSGDGPPQPSPVSDDSSELSHLKKPPGDGDAA